MCAGITGFSHFFGRLRRRELLEILKWGRMLLAFYQKFVSDTLLAFYAQLTSLLAYPDPMHAIQPYTVELQL